MKVLEDTKCEIRRSLDLQLSIWDRLNCSIEEDGTQPVGCPSSNGSFARLGDFFEDAAYAWLSCGPRLVVLNVKTGTIVGSWTFRDKVTCVSQFPAQPGQVPLLLVGLDNGACKIRDSSGAVCVFDCTTSQVLRAIRTPAGVEQLCVISGGAAWEDYGDKRTDNFIKENNGMACVALRNLDHIIIDLRRASWEGPDAAPLADESSPAALDFSDRNETPSSRHRSSRELHAAYNLMNSRIEHFIGFNREEFESGILYEESLTSSMMCSRKIGCLISGCFGRIIIWQMDGSVRWVSPPPSEESPSIGHLALLEPTDDPRPFCYLWAVYQEDNSRFPPVLRMYAMLFERKYSDKGANAYYNLEGDPSLKFELELEEGSSVTNLSPVIRESNSEQTEWGNRRGEDSLLLISLNARVLLFDLNQWYKEQMPNTIAECQNPNAFLASYRTRRENVGSRAEEAAATVSSRYIPTSLKEFPSNGSSPPEELFFPNSLSLEWIDLETGKFIFWRTRGLQAELLREMFSAGPVILIEPSETFRRCLSAGLIASSAEMSFNSDKDAQRETLLSLCLEQRSSHFLIKCAREWSDGSASYLFHAFLRWVMQRASSIKLTAHRYCIPLYDQSGSSIGEAEVKTLRFFAQQLECITNVVNNLRVDSVDLTKQRRALRRISTYLQVLLWFYDVGLLPESQELEEEAALPIGFSLKIPYPFERLGTIYREKREQFRREATPRNLAEHEEDLFIDELVSRECSPLKSQWEKEGTELSAGGNYPPSSLQSLLRSYLTDCHTPDSDETENKHQITIYLLMDLAMLLQGSCPGVDQLIKYPSAFKLSPSLIKLTQALWLLDHEDYHGFLDMMTGQLVSDSDVRDWHHRLVLRTLIRNNQNKLALIYLRVRKPPLSSLDDQGTVISLSVEHGLVQSAFHRRPPSHYAQLLTRFFRACKTYGKLSDILHLALDAQEEEAFVKFLEKDKSDETRLLYYLQRCRYAEAGTVFPTGRPTARGSVQKYKEPAAAASLSIFSAYNATLPEITRQFSGNVTRRVHEVDPESRYPRPMSHRKNRGGESREIHEMVIRKAKETFLRGERSQIPFISAPCSSLRAGIGNVGNNNCVLFVERAKKPYGKRTLDDRRDDDDGNVGYNNGEERKRRKTTSSTDTPDKTDGKEMGMSMVFDTPLVKRKNQMISARNSPPVETPHSILKIRQMIRDSTSPGIIGGPLFAEVAEEKSRKPRQIRFSIGQQMGERSMLDDDAEKAGGEGGGGSSMARGDVAGESDEAEGNVGKGSKEREEDEEEEEEEKEEEEEESESFFSPNVSSKSLSDTTLLSESSFASKSAPAGPRPRPGLRRSNQSENDSSGGDLLRKSLMKASDASRKRSSWYRASDDESNKISDDPSFSSFDDRNVAASRFPQSPKPRASLLSTSLYSSSILSSDTSFERTPVVKRESEASETVEETASSFSRQSVENCLDFTGTQRPYEITESFSRFSRQVRVKSIARTSLREECSSRDGDEDKNSEVLMEVDGFGLDRDSDTRSRADMESNWEAGDKRESFAHPITRSFAIPEESQTENLGDPAECREEAARKDKEDEENVEEQRDDWSERKIAASESSENAENVQVDKEPESPKPLEDYEDELMALKYEEDDEEDAEETFQSLSNSLEMEQLPKAKAIAAIENPSGNNGLNVTEPNITDDESSRSVAASLTNESTSGGNNEILEKTVSLEKISAEIGEDGPNITDDESDGTCDSSRFFGKIRQNAEPENWRQEDKERVTNEGDSSLDSSIFSGKYRKNEDSRKELRIARAESQEANRSSSSLAETVATNAESEVSEGESESREATPVKRRRQSSRLSKIGSATPSKSPARATRAGTTESANATPVRVTRSRRASSVALDAPASPLPESPLVKSTAEKTGRLRRASSLATDVFPSIDSAITRSLSMEAESPAKRGGLRRSVSLAKEIFGGRKALDESRKEEESPVRRSTRQSASAQREISGEAPKTPVKVTRTSSKVSLAEETVDEEEVAVVNKRTRGGRAASVGKDSEARTARRATRGATPTIKEIPEENESVSEKTRAAPKRLTRAASSLAKESVEESSEEIEEKTTKRTTTRKRGSSVPKEMEVTARNTWQRARRGSSVNKDVIPEESNDAGEEVSRQSSGRGSGGKIGAPKSASPATSTRARLSSISSIPEAEEEEIFSAASTVKASEKRRSSSARERRAVSMDPPQAEVKRRTRAGSVKSAISEDPIEEEPSEATEIPTETKTKSARKPPARRKRTASGTSYKEETDSVVEKLPPRRTRKLSERSNDSADSFKFSPPDRAQDRPDDDHNEMDDVPNYVFSPPHTRSKHNTSIQPRREIKDFIPLTEEERNAPKQLSRSRTRKIIKTSKSTDLWDPHAVFVLPKRSKGTMN